MPNRIIYVPNLFLGWLRMIILHCIPLLASPCLTYLLIENVQQSQLNLWMKEINLLKNVQVQAIIGPMFSGQARFLISLGDTAQVLVITFSATSPSLTSTRSPYFVRATLNDSYLTDALGQVNARIPYRSVISPLATDDQIVAELYKLMTMSTRAFIVHMLSSHASRLFTKVKQLGMMSQEYAWIITDGITNELNSMDSSVIESMLGVVGVRPYVPKTKELDDFTIRYRRNNTRDLASDLDIFGVWAYDSAVALTIAAENANLTNPRYREANISRNSTDLEGVGISDANQKCSTKASLT